MVRALCLGAGLAAVFGLVGCTRTPGTVCKDATGRSIENPSYCQLYPTTTDATARPVEEAKLAQSR